jgi:hypothetical protein
LNISPHQLALLPIQQLIRLHQGRVIHVVRLHHPQIRQVPVGIVQIVRVQRVLDELDLHEIVGVDGRVAILLIHILPIPMLEILKMPVPLVCQVLFLDLDIVQLVNGTFFLRLHVRFVLYLYLIKVIYGRLLRGGREHLGWLICLRRLDQEIRILWLVFAA